MIKNIGLFCASENHIAPVFFDEAVVLGEYIGKKGFRLIYGGANVGLMEETALNVKKHGGFATGIITSKIIGFGKKSELPDRIICVETLGERKQAMMDLADIFVALPGGFGTLDEIFSVIAAGHLGYHRKKVLLCNTDGFYDKLLKQFEYFYDLNFASVHYSELYTVAENAAECTRIIDRINDKTE